MGGEDSSYLGYISYCCRSSVSVTIREVHPDPIGSYLIVLKRDGDAFCSSGRLYAYISWAGLCSFWPALVSKPEGVPQAPESRKRTLLDVTLGSKPRVIRGLKMIPSSPVLGWERKEGSLLLHRFWKLRTISKLMSPRFSVVSKILLWNKIWSNGFPAWLKRPQQGSVASAFMYPSISTRPIF